MELKKRTPSRELQILNSLSPRLDLSEKDKKNHYNLQKGYEGELHFDHILDDQLRTNCLIIKDLHLTFDSNSFQIDTLIIFPTMINFFEIKNFEGEHFYDPVKDKFYIHNDYEIQNPEHQMSRAETLLRKLLYQYGYKVEINGSVVFVNPEFTLFNAPSNKPFYLPTQINSLIRKLNQNHQSQITGHHMSFAKKLISLHDHEPPVKRIPNYNYQQLKRGIRCHQCNSLSVFVTGHYCYCRQCGGKEKFNEAIIRSVKEYTLLFPNEKITKKRIHEWCGGIVPEQRIKRILLQHCRLVNKNRSSYYELPTTNE